MKILVVGGGTAGLVAATILKKALNSQVDIVRSKDIGIVGVGEGSTEHFRDFLEFIGVSHYDVIKNANATFKSGIMFENWNDRPYLHSVHDTFNVKFGEYPYVYAHQIANGSHHISPDSIWQNQVNSWFINRPEHYAFYQMHFNTHMLNSFLTDVAEKMGCNVFDDMVTDISFNESGYIDKIIGEKKEYDYDFYVDATGFKRLLIGKMGAEWESFSKYLKMNSAITFQSPNDGDNFNLWTLARGMDAGWMFRLPTWDHYGNGYIYNDQYIDEEQARQEISRYMGYEVEVGKRFSFDPGHLKEPWIKNCVAIGLTSAFVEPLEATSIGTSILQSFLLMHRILGYDQKSIKEYNRSFTSIMNNVRDFIALHYITNRADTAFWIDNQNNEIPSSLGEKLEHWRNHMPIIEDFQDESRYHFFASPNYVMVLEGLDLFNRESIRKEYLSLSPSIQKQAAEIIKNEAEFTSSLKKISHKKYIQYIREI